MDKRWRSSRRRSLQDCQIREDQVPRHCPQGLYRDLRLGTETVSQVHGLQVFFGASASPALGRPHGRGRDKIEGTLRVGIRLPRCRPGLGFRLRHLLAQARPRARHAAHHRHPAQFQRHAVTSVLRQRGGLRQHLRKGVEEHRPSMGRIAHFGGLHRHRPNHGVGQQGHRDSERGDGPFGRRFHAQESPKAQVPLRTERQGVFQLRQRRIIMPNLLHDPQQAGYDQLVKK